MQIEVAYALPDEAFLQSFEIDNSTSVNEAIEISGVLKKYPEIDLKVNQIGVFGKVIALDYKLRDKDRIEIYRPLIADPKEVRKRKAAEREAKKLKEKK
jgi:putative ubiquitin-RnfH superfamily antitoxin RatB of RatAB toxin-antitoxin module